MTCMLPFKLKVHFLPLNMCWESPINHKGVIYHVPWGSYKCDPPSWKKHFSQCTWGLPYCLRQFKVPLAASSLSDRSDSSSSLAYSYLILKHSSKEGDLEKLFTPGNTHNKGLSQYIQHKIIDIKGMKILFGKRRFNLRRKVNPLTNSTTKTALPKTIDHLHQRRCQCCSSVSSDQSFLYP